MWECPRCIQISQSQGKRSSDILQTGFRIRSAHGYLNIFNRVHVNTAIESFKWRNDSQPAKPHCQKIPLTCTAQKKPSSVFFNYTVPNQNKLGLVSQNLISTFRFALFKCKKKRILGDKALSYIELCMIRAPALWTILEIQQCPFKPE